MNHDYIQNVDYDLDNFNVPTAINMEIFVDICAQLSELSYSQRDKWKP